MAALAGWLARAAWHTALRHRRASLTRRQHERRAAVEIAAGRPEEMDPQVRQEIEFEVYKALDRLPEVYREPLLQSPAGTIAARLSRGRDMLRRRLAVQGYVVTAVALAGILEDRPARASVAVEGECVREVLAAVASTSGTGRALGAILHPRIAMASGVASSWAMGAATVLISASAFVAGASAGNYVGSYLPLWKAKVFGGSGSASKEQAAEEYPEAAPEAPRPHWTGGSATVPEPGMGVLLAVVGLGLLRRRRGPQPM
jgi:hypothetical protein